MSPQERTIADVILRGFTVRIAVICVIFIATGVWGVSAAYFGLKKDIEVIKAQIATHKDCQCNNSVAKK